MPTKRGITPARVRVRSATNNDRGVNSSKAVLTQCRSGVSPEQISGFRLPSILPLTFSIFLVASRYSPSPHIVTIFVLFAPRGSRLMRSNQSRYWWGEMSGIELGVLGQQSYEHKVSQSVIESTDGVSAYRTLSSQQYQVDLAIY